MNQKDIKIIKNYLSEVSATLAKLPVEGITQVVELLEQTRANRKRVYIFGNGGSAATASHFASDLSKGAISKGKPRIKAFALTDNVPLLSAWANDTAYENIFAEQLMNFIEVGDIAIGISGSGNSQNVLNGVRVAKAKGVTSIGFIGFDGGKLKDLVDIAIVVPNHNMENLERRTMNILVTGGAGYVGSVVAEKLLQQGYYVIILDNLQQGHKGAAPPEAELVLADICEAQALEDVFHRFKIDAVMHMAAETVVGYSMSDPKRYFRNNIVAGINLLDAMLKHEVYKFVFSSSAAVYGDPKSIPIEEDHPKLPVNSYGESKLMFEHILEWYGKAYGLKHISLRYFNAAGATELLGEDHRPETHLIPNVFKAALDKNNPVSLFGTDYPTKDRSCTRDYVHVMDIAQAHILALEKIEQLSGRAYNLGNGEGYSVFEVVETAKKVTGADIPVKISSRRPGDPAVLVASSRRAKEELGWSPEFPQLEVIIESAWKWMRKHPEGYE